MPLLIRTIVYSTAFISVVLVLLPARVLQAAHFTRPAATGLLQVTGLALVSAGAALCITCIATFAAVGKGTPLPFDPPRRLVIRGPYRFVRNPMYLGAALALTGAALHFMSAPLLGYAIAFLAFMHGLVRLYEEPTLQRMFGEEYTQYCARVRRWLPSSRGIRTH